jgi:hypothetical protein
MHVWHWLEASSLRVAAVDMTVTACLWYPPQMQQQHTCFSTADSAWKSSLSGMPAAADDLMLPALAKVLAAVLSLATSLAAALPGPRPLPASMSASAAGSDTPAASDARLLREAASAP